MFITDKDKLREYYSDKRIWQGVAGIERTKGGRLFATWYSGGTAEAPGNFQILIQSDDDGESWTEPVAVAAPKEGARCFDGGLWIDPLQRLWFYYSEDDSVMAAVCDNPDADDLLWQEPRRIGDGVMLNKPIVLSGGEWLFPIAVWKEHLRDMFWTSGRAFEEGSYVYKTSDNGRTFSICGKADVSDRSYDEHMLLEHKDGSLSMYVRTNYGIGVSHSYDGGKTWTEGKNSELGGPCSRFHIRRLKSGRILLINHYQFTGRNHLMLMLSEDDGETFPYKLMLDERAWASYPDATQSDNGFIYVITDFQRGCFKKELDAILRDERAIFVSKMTEEDIMAGYLKNPESYLLRTVNRLNIAETTKLNPFHEAKYYSEEAYISYLLSLENKKIAQSIFENYGAYCDKMVTTDSAALDSLLDNLFENVCREDTVKSIVKLVRREEDKAIGQGKSVVSRIISYIQENLDEDINETLIAEKLGISKYYMCHAFQAKTGITIAAYGNTARLAAAKRMLITTEEKINSIAEKCGFSDAGCLETAFKEVDNITPSEYKSIHS